MPEKRDMYSFLLQDGNYRLHLCIKQAIVDSGRYCYRDGNAHHDLGLTVLSSLVSPTRFGFTLEPARPLPSSSSPSALP